MSKLRIIIFAFLAILLAGCSGGVKDIKVTSFKIISLAPQGTSSITALVEVGLHNPIVGFEVTDVNVMAKLDGQQAIELTADQLMVEGKSDKLYTIPLKGHIAEGFNPLKLLKLIGNGMDLSVVTADVSGKVALRGGLGKKIEMKDVKVAELLESGKDAAKAKDVAAKSNNPAAKTKVK